MSKQVIITDCAIAGIHKTGFLTGEKHTNKNGTRYEVITFNHVKDDVVQIWLSDYCFSVSA